MQTIGINNKKCKIYHTYPARRSNNHGMLVLLLVPLTFGAVDIVVGVAVGVVVVIAVIDVIVTSGVC